jgi:hypothetical protein
MMIICEKHGCQPAMQVSRDLVDAKGQVSPDMQLVKVEYEYEGTIADRYHLSPAFAGRLGFTQPTVLPLPDIYPPWVDEIPWSAVCVKCFDESRGRSNP